MGTSTTSALPEHVACFPCKPLSSGDVPDQDGNWTCKRCGTKYVSFLSKPKKELLFAI